MIWQRESEKAFPEIRDFYWRLIDDMASVNDRIGWKKGIYPSDDFLIESLKKGGTLQSAGEWGYSGHSYFEQ